MQSLNEYNSVEHALQYLAIADKIPHRTAGEAALLEFIPPTARRILDLGAGDGRLLALLRLDRPAFRGIAADLSPTMLDSARARFAGDPLIEVIEYDLDQRLPDLGTFDAIVSCFAIHHCSHERKHSLYAEIFAALEPEGVFYNLEHVASPTPELHAQFLDALGITPEQEDQSNQLLDVQPQLEWMREIGYQQVDCHWKWRELALFGGIRPSHESPDRRTS
ncbi:MAG: class I SAM-dependent methyltransferase [Gemmatimonadaceae bacterium]